MLTNVPTFSERPTPPRKTKYSKYVEFFKARYYIHHNAAQATRDVIAEYDLVLDAKSVLSMQKGLYHYLYRHDLLDWSEIKTEERCDLCDTISKYKHKKLSKVNRGFLQSELVSLLYKADDQMIAGLHEYFSERVKVQ